MSKHVYVTELTIMWNTHRVDVTADNVVIYMSHFSYTCKTGGENGISRLISETELLPSRVISAMP